MTSSCATGKWAQGNGEPGGFYCYINSMLIESLTCVVLETFQCSQRSIDEPPDAAVQSGDRAREAPVDALVVDIVRVQPRYAQPEDRGPDQKDEFPTRPILTQNDGVFPRVLTRAEPGVLAG